MSHRSCGVLLHPTSLPGGTGLGDLGRCAYDLIDWLASAGQSYWQVLPLGPTGLGNSPYSALSAFAGNPRLISIERVVEEGLLAQSALGEEPPFPPGRAAYDESRRWQSQTLRRSWASFSTHASESIRTAFDDFLGSPDQAGWLDNWTIYAALKNRHDGAPWYDWPTELRLRELAALAAAGAELADEIAFQGYLQFLFYRQWDDLRGHAASRGIRIFGDTPIYVALDSAEVWASPELFELDETGRPLKIAGVPPDYFSETGQLWGNPIYRWDRMAEDGYSWWIERLRSCLRQVDLLRLDHFRGFAGYWEVNAGEATAVNGVWREGPGIELFHALEASLGELPLVAEDLGVITPDVIELRRALDLPGMKVLQFGFGEIDSEHLPHNVTRPTVYYTGTHDNDTVVSWFAGLDPEERQRALDYLGGDGSAIDWDMIRAVATSRADLAIFPMQDLLGLGAAARLNTPGLGSGNWEWRLSEGQTTPEVAARLRRIVEVSARLPAEAPDSTQE